MVVEFCQMGHEMDSKMAWRGSWTSRGNGSVENLGHTDRAERLPLEENIWRGRGRPLKSLCGGQCPVMEDGQKPKFQADSGLEGIVMCSVKLGTSQSITGRQSPICLVRTAALCCCDAVLGRGLGVAAVFVGFHLSFPGRRGALVPARPSC